ncbi:hypothetical protein [uncultured Bifidobacterium sp.]|uniref:hypothetical protein n=1 Tax=uncultured Bifidobacterium sp. TaxID=165187 RepID=UPI0025896B67|nr:hypothetical protein [uncultured Bifidobacterium sp.]
MSTVILTGNNRTITLDGSQDYRGPGIALTSIQGWYETPNPKVNTTSRNDGDGGHDINPQDILYEARVITLGYRILAGTDRALALSLLADLDRLVHGLVDCRVIDHGRDAYCAGGYYARSLDQKSQNPAWQNITGSITLVYERPELLSYRPHRFQLLASRAADGATGVGLSYNQQGYITYWQGTPNASPSVMEIGTNRGRFGLAYPLAYSGSSDMGNVASQSAGLLRNEGTSRAYPVFTCNGPFPNGVALDFPSLNASVECAQPVYDVPLVLDCRARSATVGGLDVSRRLSRRGFPVVEPGGTLVVVLRTGGTGWVDCSIHDTYM